LSIIAIVINSRFSRFGRNLMHTRCRIHHEIALAQTQDSKVSISPSCVKFVHWLPRYASTVFYRSIALLQLFHRWNTRPGNYGYAFELQVITSHNTLILMFSVLRILNHYIGYLRTWRWEMLNLLLGKYQEVEES
jgi:hypothetical protein